MQRCSTGDERRSKQHECEKLRKSGNDGIVPEASVAAGKYIFQNQVKSYTAMTVTGVEADHSDLPQNKQVIKVIKQYLLEPRKLSEPQNTGQAKGQ